MNALSTNLQDLIETYYINTNAIKLDRLLKRESTLSRELAKKNYMRALNYSINDFIQFCSIVEIAATTGYAQIDINHGFFISTKNILNNPYVKICFSQLKRSDLVISFYERLRGNETILSPTNNDIYDFFDFLSFDRSIGKHLWNNTVLNIYCPLRSSLSYSISKQSEKKIDYMLSNYIIFFNYMNNKIKIAQDFTKLITCYADVVLFIESIKSDSIIYPYTKDYYSYFLDNTSLNEMLLQAFKSIEKWPNSINSKQLRLSIKSLLRDTKDIINPHIEQNTFIKHDFASNNRMCFVNDIMQILNKYPLSISEIFDLAVIIGNKTYADQ